MNLVFSLILFFATAILIFINPTGVMPSMLSGVEAGFNFAIRLFFIYTIWLSVLQILQKSGAEKGLARLLGPMNRFLFKDEDKATYSFIGLNMSANLLGMGGAATPMGIKAVESMRHKKNKIMLVVINSASIQLIPTTIIAMRSELGATTDVILPCVIVNAITTLVGIVLVKAFVR